MSTLKIQKCAMIVDVFSEGNFVASVDVPLATREDAIQRAREFVQLHYPYLNRETLNFSVKEASKLNMEKRALRDQQKFIDQLKVSKDPKNAEKGHGYFITWADGRAQVAYKQKQDAIDFIGQDSEDPYGMEVVDVKYREAEKGERVRNKFTEASAKTYRAMKKAYTGIPPLEELPEGVAAEGEWSEEERKLQDYIQHPEKVSEFYERARVDRETNPSMIDTMDILRIYELEYKRHLATQYNDVEHLKIMESELTDLLQKTLLKMKGPEDYSPTIQYQEVEDARNSGDIKQMLIMFHRLLNEFHESGYMAEHYIGAGAPDWLTYLSETKELPQTWERQYLYSNKKLNLKKSWDNPQKNEDYDPGSNVSCPVPHSTPKSPGAKPRRDQRTIEDYHAPSQLDRENIPGEAQPEQGTGGQSHSGEPRKPDNIYPEPMNWLRPLKGLPFTDEHLLHDFNEDFDTEYYIRQRGLNMRRRKFALNMTKKAQEGPKWADPEYLGYALYDHIKGVLQARQNQIRENPELAEELINDVIPTFIEQNQQLFVDAGVTLPIMLEAVKDAARLLVTKDKLFLDTLLSEQKAIELYPDPRQRVSEIPQMTMSEARVLDELSHDEIWDIARNPETENTPLGEAARGLIQKGIVASRLNMKKKSIDIEAEANRIAALWRETAKAAGVEEILNLFADRTNAYNMIMADIKGIYSKEDAHAIALRVMELVPQIIQTGSKLNMKKKAEVNPKYDHGAVQTSDVSETVTDAIKDIQGRIDKDKLYSGEDEPGWVENGIQKLFHITVLFGVNDDVKDEVKKVFDKYRPVHIETTEIKYFSSDPNYDVAIVRCKSEELTKIHDELRDTLENKETYPNYKPHVTIAYLKKGERLDDSEQITNISWEVDSLDLSTSDGKLEKISALAIPIRESLDYPHSWRKRKKKKKDKEVVTEKEKKILQMDSNKLNLKKKAQEEEFEEEVPQEDRESQEIAQDPNTSPEVLAQLATHEDRWVRLYVAYNKNTLPDTLIQLSIDTDENVRCHIANHPNTPTEILTNLLQDKDWSVRRIALDNPNTPKSELSPPNEGYDFGGGENPRSSGLVVVDLMTKEEFDEPNPLITADISEPLSLEPVEFINVSSVILNFAGNEEDVEQVVINIDNALLPGGRVDVYESQWIAEYIINRLSSKGYKVIQKDIQPEEDEGGMVDVILQKPQAKMASILDEPRAELDPAIWSIGEDNLPFLKPDVKIHIVKNFFDYISQFGGYNYTEEFVKNMFYTGSTATYTYADKSDIDIHIVVDWNDLAALNPDKARKDPKEMWQELHDIFWWTLNKQKLPGTKHPLTYYVMPPGEEKKLVEQKEEIYDIGHSCWIIPPGKAVNLTEEVIDPALKEANEFMERIESHISDARKGVIDLTLLQEVITPENAADRYMRIVDKIKEIDGHLKELKEEYAMLKKKRQDAFEKGDSLVGGNSNWSMGNIIFKVVERYHYMDVLRKIKRITDDMDLAPDQIPDVAEALGLDLNNE